MPDLYSYSRLSTFTECPRNYYYTYVKGQRGGESVYTYLGTAAHDLAEAIDTGDIDNETAVARFLDAIEEVDMLCLPWISDRAKTNYIECVTHFLQNHQKSNDPNLKIEDVFAVVVGNAVLYGFIDKWYRTDDTIYIIDYKTSSKFSGSDLAHKKIQLYTYAEALSRYYPDHKIIIQYNMMKYACIGKTLKPRNELSIDSKYQPGIISFEYTDECRRELIDFVNTATNGINDRDKYNVDEWEMLRDPNKDFFCSALCSHQSKCLNNTEE